MDLLEKNAWKVKWKQILEEHSQRAKVYVTKYSKKGNHGHESMTVYSAKNKDVYK